MFVDPGVLKYQDPRIPTFSKKEALLFVG